MGMSCFSSQTWISKYHFQKHLMFGPYWNWSWLLYPFWNRLASLPLPPHPSPSLSLLFSPHLIFISSLWTFQNAFWSYPLSPWLLPRSSLMSYFSQQVLFLLSIYSWGLIGEWSTHQKLHFKKKPVSPSLCIHSMLITYWVGKDIQDLS